MPFVDKRPLDLYRLKKAVESRGGFDKVCRAKKWAEIGRDLGYSGKIMSSLSTSLKNSYQKWLCPYEDFLRVAKPGVHQQLEWENGGPLTPSPAPSPMKHSSINTPSRADSPARHASSALQASVTSERDTPAADAQTPVPTSQPVSTGGFKAINSGGFIAVNSGFTSVNRPIASEPPQASTPTKSFGTPMTSAKNTPEYRPSSLGPANGLKRQMSHDSLDSSRENGVDIDDDGGSRRSKRLKKGTSVPTSSLGPFTHPLPENPLFVATSRSTMWQQMDSWEGGRRKKQNTAMWRSCSTHSPHVSAHLLEGKRAWKPNLPCGRSGNTGPGRVWVWLSCGLSHAQSCMTVPSGTRFHLQGDPGAAGPYWRRTVGLMRP